MEALKYLVENAATISLKFLENICWITEGLSKTPTLSFTDVQVCAKIAVLGLEIDSVQLTSLRTLGNLADNKVKFIPKIAPTNVLIKMCALLSSNDTRVVEATLKSLAMMFTSNQSEVIDTAITEGVFAKFLCILETG